MESDEEDSFKTFKLCSSILNSIREQRSLNQEEGEEEVEYESKALNAVIESNYNSNGTGTGAGTEFIAVVSTAENLFHQYKYIKDSLPHQLNLLKSSFKQNIHWNPCLPHILDINLKIVCIGCDKSSPAISGIIALLQILSSNNNFFYRPVQAEFLTIDSEDWTSTWNNFIKPNLEQQLNPVSELEENGGLIWDVQLIHQQQNFMCSQFIPEFRNADLFLFVMSEIVDENKQEFVNFIKGLIKSAKIDAVFYFVGFLQEEGCANDSLTWFSNVMKQFEAMDLVCDIYSTCKQSQKLQQRTLSSLISTELKKNEVLNEYLSSPSNGNGHDDYDNNEEEFLPKHNKHSNSREYHCVVYKKKNSILPVLTFELCNHVNNNSSSSPASL